MRIVIDLQACQSAGSRFRGIGRYSRALALAMLRAGRGHDFWIALNGGLGDAVEEIRAGFDGLLPQEQIVLWDNPFPACEHQESDPWKNRIAEVVREDFLSSLQPDLVHLTSLFEGWDDAIAASIGRGSAGRVATAVTLYDLIPLANSEVYLRDPPTRRWYQRKLEDLGRADLCLAISEYTRQQGMRMLRLPAETVTNISGSIDPVFRRLPSDAGRGTALRARYGLVRPFLMYTGGFDPRKNIAGLIRAYAALPTELRARRQLAIVGKPPGAEHAELQALAEACGLSSVDCRFVGFVPDADLVQLYNICELYVFPSRCEGFGLPALEAMACGAPVIAADATSLPEVIGFPDALFDAGSDAAMSASMLRALTDAGFRQRLVDHAAERVPLFSWEHSANLALDAFEAMPTGRRVAALDRWPALAGQSGYLAGLLGERQLAPEQYRRLAEAQSRSLPAPRIGRQLIVDISNLARHDARTGIQRVVRNILRELLDAPPSGHAVVPVYFDDHGICRHASCFVREFSGQAPSAAADTVLEARAGDVFLGLDLSAHIIPPQFEQFDRLRRVGVRMYFVVYDLLPLLRPDCINPLSLDLFRQWFAAIGTLADGLCCISRAVADELLEWCDQERPARLRPLHIGHFHLGADFDVAAVSTPAMLASDEGLAMLGGRRTFLMVSTIEPRKGYRQALAAFESLWTDGVDVNLAIVGKVGWLMDGFVAELRRHPEFNRRLHWFDGASDQRLRGLYAASSVLLSASEGEGFGLPIIEAARHRLPVLVRDLPVFREVAGEHAYYFSGFDADDLATALRDWLSLHQRGLAPVSEGLRFLDWRESAQRLLGLVLGQCWDADWLPAGRYRFPATDSRLQTQVGRRVRQEMCSDGRSGFLVYGPYAQLAAGHYRLRVHGRWNDARRGQAWLDIVTMQGQDRLAHLELQPGVMAGEGTLVETEFALATDARDLEIRLWISAETGLHVRELELLCIDAPGQR